jgi:energy-coupling factor transporter transmembrane protein EcfT
MRNTLKFLLYAALILFVGVPVGFALFVVAMSLFGVVVGVGLGIVGLILTALKFALMVILPIALLVWIAKRMLSSERTY